MRKFLKVTAAGLAVLLLLLLTGWVIARMIGPSPEEQAAVELLERPVHFPGANAAVALWLLPYPVPEDELAEWSKHEVAEGQPNDSKGISGDSPHYVREAARRFPDQSLSGADREMACTSRGDNCLNKVRQDLPAYRAWVKRNAALLERIDALRGYGHIELDLSDSTAPFPPFQTASVALTRNAVLFADGNVDHALEATCRDLDTWRRLGTYSNSLIARMIGIAYSTQSNGVLLADMLRELPSGHPLPAVCRTALRPVEDVDRSVCLAMRGEFTFVLDSLERGMAQEQAQAGALDRFWWSLVFDKDKTMGMSALAFAQSCMPAQRARIREDLAVEHFKQPEFGFANHRCIDNAAGCILHSISSPGYSDYARRAQDHGAQLQVLGTLLWLHEYANDSRLGGHLPLAQRIALRPQELKSPARDVEISEDGRTLRILQYDTSKGRYWQVPLPEYLVESQRR